MGAANMEVFALDDAPTVVDLPVLPALRRQARESLALARHMGVPNAHPATWPWRWAWMDKPYNARARMAGMGHIVDNKAWCDHVLRTRRVREDHAAGRGHEDLPPVSGFEPIYWGRPRWVYKLLRWLDS